LAETYNVSLEENDAVALSQFCSIRELSSDSEQFNSAVSVQIAFRNLFLHLAEASDLVFLLEDIHNADDFSLEILRFIIANSERIRPFVCVRRSSFTLSPVKVYTLLTGAKFTKSAMFFPLVS
jgi:predicted ATPase